ncbi:unnamed protein product, partial [Rotaria sp. Silwood1]
HLTQQVQRKPALYGAGQRKYNNFHKFQTGTTTTFNGYTNYNGNFVVVDNDYYYYKMVLV